MEYDNLTEWLLSSLRITSLGDMLKYHNKAILEDAPTHTKYLEDILNAIDIYIFFWAASTFGIPYS